MIDADRGECHVVLHADVNDLFLVALRRNHGLGLHVDHSHGVVNVDAHRHQGLPGGREAECLDALGELALDRWVLKLHGHRIPDADHGLRTDLTGSHQSLVWREGDGRHIIDMTRHEALGMRLGVVGDAQACRMIDNVLVLTDGDIVSGIMAAVAMNPLELQLYLRGSILLHGRLKVGSGCADLSKPR